MRDAAMAHPTTSAYRERAASPRREVFDQRYGCYPDLDI
jgi:hypothetical protein